MASSDAKSVVAARFKELMDAYNSGDLQRLVDCYTDDCQAVGPKKPIVIGREALLTISKDFKESGANLMTYDRIDHLHVSPDGEMAYVLARVDLVKADGSSMGLWSNLIVFKKIDGVYYACCDMFN